MMKVQRQIVSLYLSNPTFLVLGVFFVISMVASKVLFHSGYVYYADETFSILFVASLWLAFYFGMLVKLVIEIGHFIPLHPHNFMFGLRYVEAYYSV